MRVAYDSYLTKVRGIGMERIVSQLEPAVLDTEAGNGWRVPAAGYRDESRRAVAVFADGQSVDRCRARRRRNDCPHDSPRPLTASSLNSTTFLGEVS
jgi:hypothetical protein